ncbi:MAG TPA: hypothetical protein VE465_13915 [Streptosporangiaceae bacterium]|jgi:hypothetical protein|nr:hypothetical protein [Streptosporangiaceae bacterium]
MTVAANPIEKSRAYFAYFNQGEWWVPNGKPPIRVTDMDSAWRHNAAAFLVRRARGYLFYYGAGEIGAIFGATAREVIGEDNGQPVFGRMVSLAPDPDSRAADALERELEQAWEERGADPEAWMKSTTLYRALVKDLPPDAAELAKHWSDCAIRTAGGECTCWERHLTECPKRGDINEICRCRDYSPEWTLS